MSIFEDLTGSYCKIALIPSYAAGRGIVQSGFVKDIDNKKKLLILENENGIVTIAFNQIRAVKKVEMVQQQG